MLHYLNGSALLVFIASSHEMLCLLQWHVEVLCSPVSCVVKIPQ